MDAEELRVWLVSDLHERSFNISIDQAFRPRSDRKAMLKQLKARIAEGHYTASKEDIVRIRRLNLLSRRRSRNPVPWRR